MQSLIAPEFGSPQVYQLIDSRIPKPVHPTEILIKVKAASVNGHDVIMASGKTKMFQHVPVPYKLGIDFAGIVESVGGDVKGFSKGDRVYGFNTPGGCLSTHLVLDTAQKHSVLTHIPAGLSFTEAASLPAVAITAIHAFDQADEFFAKEGGIRGKTVFIPAVLAGVGSVALQIAKRRWGCKTISSTSTGKMGVYEQYVGDGMVDQIVDYTQHNPVSVVGKGTVDFVLDTTGNAGTYIPMVRKGGLCISIARMPPGRALKDPEQTPSLICTALGVMDGIDWTFRTWAHSMYGVTYVYQKTEPVQEEMQQLSELVEEGKVKPVVGRTAKLGEVEEIKEACMGIFHGKGGLGKFVVEMD